MKPTVTCELLNDPVKGLSALVRRTSEHPVLGPPTVESTRTSRVINVDYEKGTFETLNTLYKFK